MVFNNMSNIFSNWILLIFSLFNEIFNEIFNIKLNILNRIERTLLMIYKQ
jgi:hypothetical protein